MDNKSPINAVGLIRVSTAGQAGEDKAGIPAQREAIRRLAEQYGLNIVTTFELIDVSGSRVLDDPDYRSFLSMLQRPDITAAVAKELSRFMRPERLEDYKILDWFGDYGITLFLPDGPMDCANRQLKFFASIRAGMAGLERQEIRDRMMGGKEALRRQGKHPSGEHTLARGIGYKKDEGWYYDETELDAVRLLFDRFLRGDHNYRRLSQLTGIPRSSIRIILTNPVYAGVMTYSKRNDLSPAGLYPRTDGKHPRRRKIPRSESEVVRFTLPLEPVITIEQHRHILSAVENLRSPRAQAIQSAVPRFTYRGYLRCGCCEDLVYSWVSGRKKNGEPKEFYYCKSRSPREREKRQVSGESLQCANGYMLRSKLEPRIDAVITEYLADLNFLTAVIEEHLKRVDSSAAVEEAQRLSAQLDKLAGKEKRILESFYDGDIDRFQKQIKLSEIANQVDEIRRALKRLQRPTPNYQDQVASIVGVFAEWRHLNMQQKRDIMEELLPEIFVDRYNVCRVTLRVVTTADQCQPVALVTTSKVIDCFEVRVPIKDRQESLYVVGGGQ